MFSSSLFGLNLCKYLHYVPIKKIGNIIGNIPIPSLLPDLDVSNQSMDTQTADHPHFCCQLLSYSSFLAVLSRERKQTGRVLVNKIPVMTDFLHKRLAILHSEDLL